MAYRKPARSSTRKSTRTRSTRSSGRSARSGRMARPRARSVSRRSAVSRTNRIVVQVVGVPQANDVATPNVQGLTSNVVRKPKVRRF